MSKLDRLRTLAEQSSRLSTSAGTRRTMLSEVAKHAENFLGELPGKPVYMGAGERSQALSAMAIDEAPAEVGEALQIIDKYVDSVGHNLGSSRFFAYIPSGGLYESALGDYLASVTNRYSGVGNASPGATRMEEVLLQWLAAMVGYPAGAEGDLTSGGSMAALSAVIAAREAHGIRSRDIERRVVYLTSQTHHTFRKALHVAGLGDCVVREVAVDAGYRMQPAALESAIVADKSAGLTPWLIGASAGTTDVGAVDPLDAIGDVASEHGLWFHVDAAYGGAFAACDPGKQRLKGLERSDSLILDPHKGFFLPCGTGVVLVRDGNNLRNAFHARGVYMQDMEHDTERSPCDLSAELTRPFRALRFWLPLKIFGTRPFAAALEEKLLLAEYFHKKVSAIPGIEAGHAPDLSIVTFRFVPGTGDANAFNRKLVDAIRDDGRVFLTSTTLNGKLTLRMAILGYNTHVDDVDVALTTIGEKIREIEDAGGAA